MVSNRSFIKKKCLSNYAHDLKTHISKIGRSFSYTLLFWDKIISCISRMNLYDPSSIEDNFYFLHHPQITEKIKSHFLLILTTKNILNLKKPHSLTMSVRQGRSSLSHDAPRVYMAIWLKDKCWPKALVTAVTSAKPDQA